MKDDPIVIEVREARQAYSKEFGDDLRAIAENLRKREQAHIGRLVSLPPKPARNKKTA